MASNDQNLLVERALGSSDPGGYDLAVVQLAVMPQTLPLALRLADAVPSEQRALGLDILAGHVQQGTAPSWRELMPLVQLNLRSDSPLVRRAALALAAQCSEAPGFEIRQTDEDLLSLLLSLVPVDDGQARRLLAYLLPIYCPLDSSGVTTAMVELIGDPDSSVRDAAAFTLKRFPEVDSEELRGAIRQVLEESAHPAPAYAPQALAVRDRQGAIEVVRQRLLSHDVWDVDVEAAELVADPSLIPILLDLRQGWKGDRRALESAIRACKSQA